VNSNMIPLIPNDYVSRSNHSELWGQRTITVRKYTASTPLSRSEIIEGIAKSQLTYGDTFGVVQEFDLTAKDRNIRILCGLVGERNLVLISNSTNKPEFYTIHNVLLATLMVEFIETSGKLELLIYGGKQGQQELLNMLKHNFGVVSLTPQIFTDIGVRNLCERMFDRLFYVLFDPYYKEGWGTIQSANFKSRRGQFIDTRAERMQQLKEDSEILIRAFKSILHGQMLNPPLEDAYNIKFEVLQDRGVSLEMPELKLPNNKGDISYETVLYDFARQTYFRIIGTEQLVEESSDEDFGNLQLTLFDV
jgi:hypothetical protein